MKKLLITGSSGMLGNNIIYEVGHKYEVLGTYRKHPNLTLKNQFKTDLREYKKIRMIIDSFKPDFIVHCAAMTNVDICEENYTLAHETNALVTKNLVSSVGPKIRFIYISTDSVFDGEKGNYSEDDLPSPLNNYAKSKLEGEQFVEQQSNNYVIIRTNIFGWNRVKKGESFAEWIYYNLSQKNKISMFTDVIFSPISANTLSLFIERLFDMDFVGTLNIGSNNAISKYDFGIRIAEYFGFDKSLVEAISIDSFDYAAKRPKNTSLNVLRARNIFGPLPTVEESISEFYKKRRVK